MKYKGIHILQLKIRNTILFKNKIKKELGILYNICQTILVNIDKTKNNNIIGINDYIECVKKIDDITTTIISVKHKISFKNILQHGIFKYIKIISENKLSLILLIENIGCCNINELLLLFLNTNISELNYSDENMDILELYNKKFNIISSKKYVLKDKNQYSLINNKNNTINEKSNSITHLNLTEVSIYPINTFAKCFILKYYGCKIYIPYKKILLVIFGYFNKENINNLSFIPKFNKKIIDINNGINNLKINASFKKMYITNLNIKDILIYDKNHITDSCSKTYTQFKKITDTNLNNIIKEFTKMELQQQQILLSNLLSDLQNSNHLLLCFILIDILTSGKNGYKNYKTIYNTFNVSQQKILNNIKKYTENEVNNLLAIGDDNIPYEKKILLMKCSNSIKNKALEKLKEINNSKGGETTSKAQQYLDGLLKIPFGHYKQENIINYIKEFIIELELLLTQLTENNFINNYPEIPTTSNEVNIFFETIDKYIVPPSENEIIVNLKKIKNEELKSILELYDKPKSGKKTVLITRVKDIISELSIKTLLDYNLISENFKMEYKNIIELKSKWDKYKTDRIDYLNDVDTILDKSVYGMSKAKIEIKRIIAQWINGSNEGYIIGFEGPPGTGKTTLAKKGIASCLRDKDNICRPFSFIALGGSTNGSTLEGHNYTYVGSTWGRIAESLMESECMNPIIYIDELDKISKTEQGKELIGILIHLTDPSQNEEFIDKYFSGVKLDISKCLIIFSYNDVNNVDRVLLDRIHRITIESLTRHDKFMIAKDYLIPEISLSVGFKKTDIIIDEQIIYYIIDNYTCDNGARKLKEKLYDIIRDINYKFLTNDITKLPFTIDKDFIDLVFKSENKVYIKKILENPKVGLVNGLYATNIGTGGITTIEAFKFLTDVRLSLELTGQQGDIMKESMRVSKTTAWNLLPTTIKESIRSESPFGIHIHCPEAAQPKDGPSAGIAITIAILSLLSNIPVNNEIAVTGEIDLHGNVLPIGGLQSKLEGAKIAGVKTVLCPTMNKKDLNKIIESVNSPIEKDVFNVIMINTIFEAIDLMLIGSNCSKLFMRYSDLSLSHNDYLLTFKSLCDKSSDLICIIDTTSTFNILYSSKGFIDNLGWIPSDIYSKSIFNYIEDYYKDKFNKILIETFSNNSELCIRLKVKSNINNSNEVVICNTKKIDNILSCTMRIVK